VGKPERKRPLRRPRYRWVNNIKMDLLEIEGVVLTGCTGPSFLDLGTGWISAHKANFCWNPYHFSTTEMLTVQLGLYPLTLISVYCVL
jgi:hypothetical protein